MVGGYSVILICGFIGCCVVDLIAGFGFWFGLCCCCLFFVGFGLADCVT